MTDVLAQLAFERLLRDAGCNPAAACTLTAAFTAEYERVDGKRRLKLTGALEVDPAAVADGRAA